MRNFKLRFASELRQITGNLEQVLRDKNGNLDALEQREVKARNDLKRLENEKQLALKQVAYCCLFLVSCWVEGLLFILESIQLEFPTLWNGFYIFFKKSLLFRSGEIRSLVGGVCVLILGEWFTTRPGTFAQRQSEAHEALGNDEANGQRARIGLLLGRTVLYL